MNGEHFVSHKIIIHEFRFLIENEWCNVSDTRFKSIMKVGTHLLHIFDKTRQSQDSCVSLFVFEIFLGDFFKHFIPAGLTSQVQPATTEVLVEKERQRITCMRGKTSVHRLCKRHI